MKGDLNSVLRTGREPVSFIRTAKGTHFTTEITQNNMETENITGLETNRLIIEAVTIQSDQNLQWELFLWGKDTLDETDHDADYFQCRIKFATTDGAQIGAANQYYYYKGDLKLVYMDLDKSQELHVALVNRSATAKNAGATGEVVVEFQVRYEIIKD